MRNTVILAAAFLATACDTPDTRQAEQAETDTAMTGDTQSAATGPDAAANNGALTTETYVTRAAISDMYEIEAGKLAMDNGQSEQTRRFGKMMVDDHTKSSQDMKAAVTRSSAAMPIPARLDAEHQAMIDRLKNAQGAAFDSEYQTQQMAAHDKALALHQGYADNSNTDNADLKAFAQQVVPVIRRHHDGVRAMTGTSARATSATNSGTMNQGNTGMIPDGQ
ncbi:DUF4142 domain-containing protein [Blastomonas aquatica]|uniref:DUF4142 domain-containing protein n=1 Tax=Blastomonas aquatica TaxID=1510276 RepID=A0ABQ1JMR7_9SPHN|nr:DUF4142 domain-containing protein [Blastomonas aquatica]GGB72245.1 hypothetical protein GCM10010833_29320 [Blastomonas aquatica]